MSPETEVDFDAPIAAAIANGMRAVANADGKMHQREMALISTFEQEIPPGTVPSNLDSLNSAELQQTYLRSLVMVALADGRISDPEYALILEHARTLGVDDSALAGIVLEVKRSFLASFAEVKVFEESVVEIANSLGLSPDDLAAVRSSDAD